jgi:hypothetical protein
MTVQDHRDREVSLRLEQILRVYCTELSTSSLVDLRDAIFAGRHAWFRCEFEDAIKAHAFPPDLWHNIIATRPALGGHRDDEVRRQQQVIWRILFDGVAFPAT